MPQDLTKLTIVQAKQMLLDKEFTAVELTQAHLNKIAQENPKLNAFCEVTTEIALQQAKNSDQHIATGTARPLEGIPMGIKSLYCTKGVTSDACSKILTGFKPEYESTVTTNLFASGGVMLGKTNMDEFAMGSANGNSCHGDVLNPWRGKEDKDLVPGGSSGGSAAAVAAGMCMGSLGSDTGGSIRQPAAFTGIVGAKPTYGRCSRYGMIAFASSLDQAGPFARTVADTALILENICGYDPKDSTSIDIAVTQLSNLNGASIKGLKVGIPKEYRLDGTNPEVLKVWDQGIEWLKEAGAEVVNISLPHTKYALPTYYVLAPAEASSNLARYDGVRYGLRISPKEASLNDMYEYTRTEGFGKEVKRRIMIGTYVLSAGYYDAYYTQAQRVRRKIANDFVEAFEKVDVILTPTTPSSAFAIGDKMQDPITMYLNDVFTVPASLAGLPAISVPAMLDSSGLPLGLQIIGRAYDEVTIFKFAEIIEKCANFKIM